MEVFHMKCLRNDLKETIMDKIGNWDMREDVDTGKICLGEESKVF